MLKIKHNIRNLSEDFLEQTPSKTSTTSAEISFKQETLFQVAAYKNSNIMPVSFSLENQHYGKLNNNLFSIIPYEDKLSIINSEQDLLVLDFVADAYFAFYEEFQSFKLSNKFSRTSKIYNFEAKGKKEDFEEKYDLFLSDQYSYFLDFINLRNLNSSIKNVHTFIKVFSEFVSSRMPATPYNQSSFLLSNRISRKVSGLVIDLDEGDPNDDNNKFENYISNEDFECFQDLVTSFGFVINKDLPWQIVADLNSVNMKYYFHLRMLRLLEENKITANPVPSASRKFEDCKDALENFDLTSEIFDPKSSLKYFRILNFNDLNNLKNTIYYFYNSFVEYEPKNTTKKIIKKENQLKIKYSNLRRNLISIKELETKENQLLILKLYILIKAKEVNADWTQTKFESVATKAFQIRKVLDEQKAIEYVHRQLISTKRTKTKKTNFNL